MAIMIMGIEHLIYVIALILLIVFVSIWSFHFLALVYGKYKFHKKSKRVLLENGSSSPPGVSIMKPLMGVDDNLRENLETFFIMDYPKFELLFCVQDPNDPAILVVRHLIEQYPNVDARLFYGGKPIGINPKINNLIQAYDHTKYDLLLISDAGLKMEKDTLWDMVSLMTDKVGLVHQMPFTCDRPGFAGSLEKVYFGTCHCRMYLFINLIGVNCVTGMSCLMRKCVLDKAGGLKAYSIYLAEDYFIAKSYLDDNWLIQLSHQPAAQNTSNYAVPLWQKRMIRWCKLRLRLTPMAWLEPFQECFMLGIMSSWTVNYLFGWNSLVFFLIHVLCWFLSDYTLLKITQNGRLPFNKFEYLLCWLYRETICYYLFLKAINPTVTWRDGTYRLKWGGKSVLVKDKVREKMVSVESGGGEAKLAAAAAASTLAVAAAASSNTSPSTPLLLTTGSDNNTTATIVDVKTDETSSNTTTSQPTGTSSSAAQQQQQQQQSPAAQAAATAAAKLIMHSNSNTAINLLGTTAPRKTLTSQQQQQHHKRTSSYSVIMKSGGTSGLSNNNNIVSSSSNHPYNSDAESNSTMPLLMPHNHHHQVVHHTMYNNNHQYHNNNNKNSSSNYHHHQHHHSVSAPVSSSPNFGVHVANSNKKYDV